MAASNQLIPLVYGLLQLNSGSFSSMPYTYFAGQNAAHGYAAGGMAFSNAAGRGQEFKVPRTGAYAIDWSQRCDITGAVNWLYVEAYISINGSTGASFGYSIQSGFAGSDIYHTLDIHTILNLNANDLINGIWASSASQATTGATYQGVNSGIMNCMTVQYLGATLTQVF